VSAAKDKNPRLGRYIVKTYVKESVRAEHMQQLGMLREITGRQRHRLFVYDAYLAILSEGTEPIR
jgi:hypothetical protein